MVKPEIKREIEELLFREAHLLDEHRFDEWLALFTNDVEYVIPLPEYVEGDVEPAGHPIIRDDKNMLALRVKKFQSGLLQAEVPMSMTTHFVTNVVVDEGRVSDELEVTSNLLIYQARKLKDESWWCGKRRDRLRRVGDNWRIARREVLLATTLLPRGITIFF
jgi:3-phenylpropionate/cinnamic acid dioxygenase small subunit